MPRYAHWLQPMRSKHWPGRVLCVAADWHDTQGAGSPGTHRPLLKSVTTQPLVLNKTGYEWRPSQWNSGSAAWWDMLANYCVRGKSLVVLSADTSRLWAILGLWERLEQGAVRLVREDMDMADPVEWACKQLDAKGHKADSTYSLGDIRREIESASGYLCLAAPPLTIRFLLPQRDAWVTWIDSGNYDAYVPDVAKGSKVTSAWLAGFHCELFKVWRGNNVGPWRPTVGGMAMAGYLHSHYRGGIHVDATPQVDKLARASYYGGRAECFRLGPVSEPLWCLDYQASYAAVMSSLHVPVRLQGFYEAPSPDEIADVDRLCCIGDVTINTLHPLYPRRYAWGVAWPVGRFRTVLAGPELCTAYEAGHVEQTHTLHVYECEPALAEYAQLLCEMREQATARGDVTLARTLKFAANAFAGRWGQRATGWEVCRANDVDIGWGEFMGASGDGTAAVYRALGGVVQRQVDDGLAPDACPAIAAWITSAARCMLARDIYAAGRANVYYVDTDCLLVDAEGRDNLIASGAVQDETTGYLGHRWGPSKVEIRGIKYYIHDGAVVCAGVPDAQLVCPVDADTYYRLHSPQDEVRRGRKPSGSVSLARYVKSLKYRHGRVQSDGRVTPLKAGR